MRVPMAVNTSILAALAAALLFGASTPFAKALVGAVPPVMLAGLLYAGSGIGLWIVRFAHHGTPYSIAGMVSAKRW